MCALSCARCVLIGKRVAQPDRARFTWSAPHKHVRGVRLQLTTLSVRAVGNRESRIFESHKVSYRHFTEVGTHDLLLHLIRRLETEHIPPPNTRLD